MPGFRAATKSGSAHYAGWAAACVADIYYQQWLNARQFARNRPNHLFCFLARIV